MSTSMNQMWEVIDLVISEEQKENEAIASCGHGEVVITYAGITDHKLHTAKATMSIWLLCTVSVPTLRLIIKEVINHLRDVP